MMLLQLYFLIVSFLAFLLFQFESIDLQSITIKDQEVEVLEKCDPVEYLDLIIRFENGTITFLAAIIEIDKLVETQFKYLNVIIRVVIK